MKQQTADEMYLSGINYKIGDEVVPKDNPIKVYGKCTGFKDGCVYIMVKTTEVCIFLWSQNGKMLN